MKPEFQKILDDWRKKEDRDQVTDILYVGLQKGYTDDLISMVRQRLLLEMYWEDGREYSPEEINAWQVDRFLNALAEGEEPGTEPEDNK